MPKTRSTTWASTWSRDRKSTRLNSSHVSISYAVFCLKKKIVDDARRPLAPHDVPVGHDGSRRRDPTAAVLDLMAGVPVHLPGRAPNYCILPCRQLLSQ